MNMKRQQEVCDDAPFYVRGPVVTDAFPVTTTSPPPSARRAADLLGRQLPVLRHAGRAPGHATPEDVKQGCIAYKIAVHAADVARKLPGARQWDDAISQAPRGLRLEETIRAGLRRDAAGPSVRATCPAAKNTAPCAAGSGAQSASARKSKNPSPKKK
jgi:phosphomethylpyrimidine synthase